MRTIRLLAISVPLLCLPALQAQKWEVGVLGGGSFFTEKTLTNGNTSAQAGFNNGFSVGGYVAQNMYENLGGEIRYQYTQNDAKLSSGGTQVTFGSRAHSIFYDFLIYTNGKQSRVRPYLLGGAGIRHYEGVGKEATYQALSNVAVFTKTTGYSAILALGGGVRFAVGERGQLRLEFVDFISPFPDRLITPTPNTTGKGWIHNFVPTVGLAYTF